MGMIVICFFFGFIVLVLIMGVYYVENLCDLIGFDCSNLQLSLMVQIVFVMFGGGSILFFIVQVVIVCVLLFVVNIVFNGFLLLGVVFVCDGYVFKLFNICGDCFVFLNGMILFGIVVIVVFVVFQVKLMILIQLYIIGVFVLFLFGQIGMVCYWWCVLCGLRESMIGLGIDGVFVFDCCFVKVGFVINLVGVILIVLVFLIVMIMKFMYGVYLVFFVILIFVFLMMGVKRYYCDVEYEIVIDDIVWFGVIGDLVIVFVNWLQKLVIKVIDYVIVVKYGKIFVVYVVVVFDDVVVLQKDWVDYLVLILFVIVELLYWFFVQFIIQFIKQYCEKYGLFVVIVYLLQYIVGYWWEMFLYNCCVCWLVNQLMFVYGVFIMFVLWLFDLLEFIYGCCFCLLLGQECVGCLVVVLG